MVPRPGEECFAAGPNTLVLMWALEGELPHSDGAPHKHTAPEEGVWIGDAATEVTGWLRGVKPHVVCLHHATPFNNSAYVLIELDLAEQASLGVRRYLQMVCQVCLPMTSSSLPAPPAIHTRHNILLL